MWKTVVMAAAAKAQWSEEVRELEQAIADVQALGSLGNQEDQSLEKMMNQTLGAIKAVNQKFDNTYTGIGKSPKTQANFTVAASPVVKKDEVVAALKTEAKESKDNLKNAIAAKVDDIISKKPVMPEEKPKPVKEVPVENTFKPAVITPKENGETVTRAEIKAKKEQTDQVTKHVIQQIIVTPPHTFSPQMPSNDVLQQQIDSIKTRLELDAMKLKRLEDDLESLEKLEKERIKPALEEQNAVPEAVGLKDAPEALEEAVNEPAAVEAPMPILSLIEVIHDPYCNAFFCPTGNAECIESVMYDIVDKRRFGAIFIESAEECTAEMRQAAIERQTQMLSWLQGV